MITVFLQVSNYYICYSKIGNDIFSTLSLIHAVVVLSCPPLFTVILKCFCQLKSSFCLLVDWRVLYNLYSIKMERELQMFEMMYNFENDYASSKYIINDDYGS